MARKVRGAILIAILGTTVLAVVLESVPRSAPARRGEPAGWRLDVPAFPDGLVATPDFSLLGHFSLFGAFGKIRVVAVLLLVFSLLLADFFDTMGTMVAIGAEAGLHDEDGNPPRTQQILVVDSIARDRRRCAGRLLEHLLHRVRVGSRRRRADRPRVGGHRSRVPARDLPVAAGRRSSRPRLRRRPWSSSASS